MTLRDQFTDAEREALVGRLLEGFAACTTPDHLREGLVRYIADGILPGGFLQAVLCNNLRETMARASFGSRGAIPGLVELLRWHAPPEAWGSREKVLAWTTTPERLEIEP